MFMEQYKKILKAEGLIHIKTDSDLLFEFTVNQIKENKYRPEVVSTICIKKLMKIWTRKLVIFCISKLITKSYSKKKGV